MKCLFRTLPGLFFLLFFHTLQAQQQGSVIGKVFDELARPIKEVKVQVMGTQTVTFTAADGTYALRLPVGKHILVFTHVNYQESRAEVAIRPAGVETIEMKMLEGGAILDTLVIKSGPDPKNLQDSDNPFVEVVPIPAELPSITNTIESKLLTSGAGVATNNEFSSQYRVRGGNFDENLVYVNDIEIYRPFLVRSGQQEGLSFVNPRLVEEVGFSSGGFQAKYGDRLSSVLDVTYKNPEKFGGSVDMSILNPGMHLEGRIYTDRKPLQVEESMRRYTPSYFTFLVGARRFTPSYVLGSLDTKGNYKPVFHDVQGMFTFVPKHDNKTMIYKTRKSGKVDTVFVPKERLKFTLLTHFANNNYRFTPETRETSFGTIQSVIRLRVGFAGQENTYYQTLTGALTAEYRPTVNLRIRHIVSAFTTLEAELFDVEGGYYLSDVNSNFGSDGYNEVVFDRGIGTFYRHARNYLFARVLAAEQRGDWMATKNLRHRISWGLRVQNQFVHDELTEWNGVDSSGYFQLQESYRSGLEYSTMLYKAYVQDYWKVSRDETMRLVAGCRVIYNALNEQLLLAPRFQFVIDPSKSNRTEDLFDQSEIMRSSNRRYQIRFAVGAYHQPLFYREMRDLDGSVNLSRGAQASYHFIAGGDYLLKFWGRQFRLFGEAYYKYLASIVPYEVENVRVRYYPYNNATGYAYGLDARITGEFIKGVDSWFTLGILRTQEDVKETPAGLVSRPSDQRFNFGMYFQDELPINPTYKVHINFVYGSGMKFGPPRVLESRTVFGAPSYQRVDLGFSKIFTFRSWRDALTESGAKMNRGVESLWISVEIFNLFQRSNVVSYTWVKDVFNTQFAVPNYLSARLLNIRATLKF